jgi:aspartate kinase
MKTVVEKYGGSSLATEEQIISVAQHVVQTKRLGHQVVVVVSAMGKTTDDLIFMAKSINRDPNRREMSLLLSVGEIISASLLSFAIQNLGYSATALTGPQAGIETEGPLDNAKISKINPERITQLLDNDEIVIVTGFQGVQNGEISVLGRGGSDATAVAIAASIGASRCHIYTDVPGVFTEDPNIDPTAELLKDLTYEKMIKMSASGARVLMQDAVEIAKRTGIEIVVGDSYEKNEGTLISS